MFCKPEQFHVLKRRGGGLFDRDVLMAYVLSPHHTLRPNPPWLLLSHPFPLKGEATQPSCTRRLSANLKPEDLMDGILA